MPCCKCNGGNARCKGCSCAKAKVACSDCYPGRRGKCMNVLIIEMTETTTDTNEGKGHLWVPTCNLFQIDKF